MHTKKYLIILILRMLETNSDKDNPITQTEIAEEISQVYPCDRKTVGRNIKFLTEIGYPIVKTARGFYMDSRLFSMADIDFIKGAIIGAEGKPEDEKKRLVDDLLPIITKHYRR